MHPLGYAYHVLQITALIQQEVRYDRKHVGFTVRLAFFFFFSSVPGSVITTLVNSSISSSFSYFMFNLLKKGINT